MVKWYTLSRMDSASFTWTGSILLFVNVLKFVSLPNHNIRVCVEGKRINPRVGYGLEIPAELLNIHFMAMRKLFISQRQH